jgi:hypothetical protein
MSPSKCQPKIQYSREINLKNIKTFSEKQKLRGFIAKKPALKETLNLVFQAQRKFYQMELQCGH